MSSSSRRSRSSLAGDKQASTNQRSRKRNANNAADESNVSFGSNVSIVFKGDESLDEQGEDEQQSNQRAGKFQKLDHNSSISQASENAGSSRPVRQAALKSRLSLTATIAATTRRRQSTRLSHNFKAELSARAKLSMAEGLLSDSSANGNEAYSSEVPATIGSVENLFSTSSSGLQQHQAGPSNQSSLIFNQHLAINANQAKDRRLSLPAKYISQQQHLAPAGRLQQLEPQKQQKVQQYQQQQQQAAGVGISAAALPYHRSSTSQPLDDVTAALLNKEHFSDASRLQQRQRHLLVQQSLTSQQQKISLQQQQQQLLQLQQYHQLQFQQQQLQLQQQKQLSQHGNLQLQLDQPQSQTSVPGNSTILNYQQQQSNIRRNDDNISCNGVEGKIERSGSVVQLPVQSNLVYRVTSGSTFSGLPQASISTSNSMASSSSSTLISQQSNIPVVPVNRQPSILFPAVTAHPIGRNVVSKNTPTNSLIQGSLGLQGSSEQRPSTNGDEAWQLSSDNAHLDASTVNIIGDNGGKKSRLIDEAKASGSHSTSSKGSFNGGEASGVQHLQVRAAADRERSSSSSDDDVMILEKPRSVTPEAAAYNSRNVSSQASTSSLSTTALSLYLSCRIRPSPLPPLTWADRDLVWRQMCLKDRIYKRSADALQRHPAVHQRMRAILLDWISEVCEVYTLHRETYYLAIDYIDRYLMVTQNVPKQQLQLLGITCLFIAAKVEEIYPPKISEFAYVTDGACRVEQITEKELVVVGTLSWNLSPLTINTWLNTYLQLLQEITRSNGSATSTDGMPIKPTEFVYQRFSGDTFVQICRLLDLCILDTSSLQFSPSLLSAAALSYFFGSHIACRVSSFTIEVLAPVQRWMKAFALVVQGLPEPAPLKSFRQVSSEDSHNIQTKVVELDSLELAQKHMERIQLADRLKKEQEGLLASARDSMDGSGGDQPWSRGSPPPVSVLTPPKTDEKRDAEMEPSEATSDHLIHSSCTSSSSGVSSAMSLEGGGAACHASTFSTTTNGGGSGGMGSVVGHSGGHRPVVYNGSDAMEVS